MKYKVFTSLVWKFMERILAQSVSLVVSLFLARLLSPDEYGVIALVMVFVYLADVFVTDGLGMSLVQKKDADHLDYSTVFYVNILLSSVIYLMLFLCAPIIAQYYEMPILKNLLRVLAIRIPIAAFNSVQQAYVSKNMDFKRFFFSTLIGTIISGVVGIYMAYNGCGVWALATQYLSNVCIDTFVLFITVKWRPSLEFSCERAKGLISFGWKMLVSGLIAAIFEQLRSMIIGKKYTASDLAYYNQGSRYPQLLVVNINDSIGSVLFPALANVQDERAYVKSMTRTAIQVSALFIWPSMLGLIAVSEPLVRFVLTEKWLPCVPFMRIFCLYYALFPHATANLQAIKALGKSDIILKLQIVKYSLLVLTLIVSFSFGSLGIAVGMLLSSYISIFINGIPNIKLLDYSMFEQIKDQFIAFFPSGIMALAVYLLSHLKFNPLIVLIFQIVLGIIIYALLLFSLKIPGYMKIIEIVSQTNIGKKVFRKHIKNQRKD